MTFITLRSEISQVLIQIDAQRGRSCTRKGYSFGFLERRGHVLEIINRYICYFLHIRVYYKAVCNTLYEKESP